MFETLGKYLKHYGSIWSTEELFKLLVCATMEKLKYYLKNWFNTALYEKLVQNWNTRQMFDLQVDYLKIFWNT